MHKLTEPSLEALESVSQMSMVTRATTIYRNEGGISLIKRTISFARDVLQYLPSKIRGIQKIRLDGSVAAFEPHSVSTVALTQTRFDEERAVLEDLTSLLHESDVFFDVGANTGLYTCFAMQEMSCENIVAFEPYPPNVTQLETNIELNGGGVRVCDVAASNQTGTVSFDWPKADRVGYGGAAITPQNETRKHETEAIAIDDLVSRGTLPQPTVVKIDVEGAEPLVVEGMKHCLQDESCRLLFCEVHLPTEKSRSSIEDFGYTHKTFKEKLNDFGFDIEILSRNSSGDQIVLKCEKRGERPATE